MVGFEGMPFPQDVSSHPLPSLRAQTRNLLHGKEYTPTTLLILLFLLLTACHSHRQSTESLTLLQRRQQQLHYRDTLWQQLSLQLDGLTIEWPPEADNVPRSKGMRLTSKQGVMHLESQKKTERQTLIACTDTVSMANHSEQTAIVVSARDGESRKGKYLVVGLVIGLLGMVLLVYWKRKTY